MMVLVYRLATSIGFEYCVSAFVVHKTVCGSQNLHNPSCVSHLAPHHPQARQGAKGGEHGKA